MVPKLTQQISHKGINIPLQSIVYIPSTGQVVSGPISILSGIVPHVPPDVVNKE